MIAIKMKKKRPSLQDVADRVGVTKMTVSRYLRNPEQVSTALGAKIACELERLNYIPNRAPDILSNATSHAIGVLLPSLTNQVFAQVIRGIESVTDKYGYQTMLAHYGYRAEKEEERLISLLSYNIDGLILAERNHTAKTIKMLETAGIPVVEIMDSVSPCFDCAVGLDIVDASQKMVNAMIERGCRRIIYLGARQDERTLMRLQGYQQAMHHAKLPIGDVMTAKSSSYTLGAELLHAAREQYPDLDGLYCTNDDIAIGAVFECQRLGISVPNEIAISGFHGHDIGQVMTPRLASIYTPRDEMGKQAADILLARMQGSIARGKIVDVGFEIITGESI